MKIYEERNDMGLFDKFKKEKKNAMNYDEIDSNEKALQLAKKKN